MGIINVAELKPEMVLAEDLRNLDGRFVLAKGTKLNSKHLRILKMWGVIEANIERISRKDVEENTIAQLDPAVIQKVKNLTGERFHHADLEHPPIRELYRLCCLRKARGRSGMTLREDLGPRDTGKKQVDSNRVSNDVATTIDPHELIRNDIKLPSLPTIYLQIS